MIWAPVSKRPKDGSGGDVEEGHQRSFDLRQGFPLFMSVGNVDTFERFGQKPADPGVTPFRLPRRRYPLR
jgi:hypothetical protein